MNSIPMRYQGISEPSPTYGFSVIPSMVDSPSIWLHRI